MDNDACGIDNTGQVRRYHFMDTFFYFVEDFRIAEFCVRDVLLVIQNDDSEVFNNKADRTDQHRFRDIVKKSICLCHLQKRIHPGNHS